MVPLGLSTKHPVFQFLANFSFTLELLRPKLDTLFDFTSLNFQLGGN